MLPSSSHLLSSFRLAGFVGYTPLMAWTKSIARNFGTTVFQNTFNMTVEEVRNSVGLMVTMWTVVWGHVNRCTKPFTGSTSGFLSTWVLSHCSTMSLIYSTGMCWLLLRCGGFKNLQKVLIFISFNHLFTRLNPRQETPS